MKQIIRHILPFFLACILLGSPVTVFAEETIIYGGSGSFTFSSDAVYTPTDLFSGMRQAMPGDRITDRITFQNNSDASDFINVYLGALLHDETGNPVSPSVMDKLTADVRRKTLSELEYMQDFLSQLTLSAWLGEPSAETLLYTGSPDSLEDGFEAGNLPLGSLQKGESLTLTVELAIPLALDDRYAGRIGEVDWVFVVEEQDDAPTYPGTILPGGGERPSDPPDQPADEPKDEPADEPDAPSSEETSSQPGEPADPNIPKTGDDTLVWPYVLLFGIGLIGCILSATKKRRK